MGPRAELADDGIVRVDYGNCGTLTLGVMRDVHAQRQRLSGSKLPVLLCANHVVGVEYDAQRFACSAAVCAITAAVAIVVRSFLQRHLVEMFLAYHRPPYPTRLFRTEEEALDWLRSLEVAATA
jgi:hypothetical protein